MLAKRGQEAASHARGGFRRHPGRGSSVGGRTGRRDVERLTLMC